METKKLVEFVEEFSQLAIQFEIEGEGKIKQVCTLQEKINYDYYIVCQEITIHFKVLYLEGEEVKLIRFRKMLNQAKDLWIRILKEPYGILMCIEDNEVPTGCVEQDDLIQVAKIKIQYIEELIKCIDDLIEQKALPPQPIVKQKPELNGKLITFKNNETIEKIHSELKGYFPNKEAELLKALQGEQLNELLLFPHNQNKFVEVFRRLKYNGFLLNTDTETKNWICTTFQFVKKGFAEPQPFNEGSVWRNLNMGKGEPPKKERICITEWLPYKSPLQLTREKENEKL